MTCPQCGEPTVADDAFCENCGAALKATSPDPATLPATHRSSLPDSDDDTLPHVHETAPSPACTACGGEVGDDGWCTVCGAEPRTAASTSSSSPARPSSGVSDKGRLHARNEDACALAAEGTWAALVVCDGVTTATDSDAASLAAARAARDVLVAAPRPGGDAATRQAHWAGQLKAAALAADVAAEATASPGDTNPPSCTFVAAVADAEVIVAAWVGDSRAYWLPDDPDSGPAEQLSVDDSWATEQIAAGVSREIAEADSRAHAITRWLGADSPDVDASTTARIATTPGWLLVCSDGLWNYCSGADDMHKLVAAQPSEPSELARAEALVKWANEQGGHDNITVTLARIAPEELRA